MKHYFRFLDRDGKREEFVVIYRRFDPELHYLRTHYRKAGESFFVTVNETVWSFSISYLIEQGKRLAGSTRPQQNHLAANVSAGELKHPDWKPPGGSASGTEKPKGAQEPPRSPYEWKREQPKAPILESNGFRVNEFVVYPAHGVGQILAIEEQEIAGAKLQLFVINFLKDKMTLRVPTKKVSNVGMRKLSEPALVKKALETLKGSARTSTKIWSERAEEIEAKINSGDIVAIAEVVRDLYRSESPPEQSYSERHLYDAALDRLSREIAVVQHSTENEAIKEIENQLANRKPRANEKPAGSDQQTKPKVSVDVSPWEISTEKYNEIGRVYEFNNLAGAGSKTRFDVRCRLTRENDGRTITPFIYFFIEPYILEQNGFLAAMFAPSDALLDYKVFTVKIEPIATGANFILVTDREDAEQCLRVLMLGRQIMLRLLSQSGPLASFPLENDGGFSESYRELRQLLLA
jgi:CarD family transcriptional regulator